MTRTAETRVVEACRGAPALGPHLPGLPLRPWPPAWSGAPPTEHITGSAAAVPPRPACPAVRPCANGAAASAGRRYVSGTTVRAPRRPGCRFASPPAPSPLARTGRRRRLIRTTALRRPGRMGEHDVRPGAGTRHGLRADGPRPGFVRPGPHPHPLLHPHPLPHPLRAGTAAAGHARSGDRGGRRTAHGPGAGRTAVPDRAGRGRCPECVSRGPSASATPRRKAAS